MVEFAVNNAVTVSKSEMRRYLHNVIYRILTHV